MTMAPERQLAAAIRDWDAEHERVANAAHAVERLLLVAQSAARGPDEIGPTQHASDMSALRRALDQDAQLIVEFVEACRGKSGEVGAAG